MQRKPKNAGNYNGAYREGTRENATTTRIVGDYRMKKAKEADPELDVISEGRRPARKVGTDEGFTRPRAAGSSVKSNGDRSRVQEVRAKKKLTKKKKKWIIFGAVGVVLVGLLVTVLILYNYTFGKVTHVTLDKNDLGIEKVTKSATVVTQKDGTTVKVVEVPEIKNIAAFGLSVSDMDDIDTNRSDVIMIISLDPANNRICITSVLRDTKAPIEGYAAQKINAAYKYGGAPLAIKTLNQNFHLDIDDYVTYNYENIADIVDYLGGIEIELTQDEIDSASLTGHKPGLNTLNGEEAVRYSRIRDIDSDYYRASRQQTVLFAMLSKVRDIPKTSYPELISMVLSCTETSLEVSEILNYATKFDLKNVKVETITIPDKQYETDLWGGIADTGEWLYIFDLEAAAKRIHETIYGTDTAGN